MMTNHRVVDGGRRAIAFFILTGLLLHIRFINVADAESCDLRPFSTGLVCVCNETFCDTLEQQDIVIHGDEVVVVSSSKSGLRFNIQRSNFVANNVNVELRMQVNERQAETDESLFGLFWDLPGRTQRATVTINRSKKFQNVVGFGGAITGSVTHLLQRIPTSMQNYLLRSYYSPEVGIGYNLMRIPIGGCDFDLAPWAYNENPRHDANLTNFHQLDQRDLDRIEFLNQVKQIRNPDANSPERWSPVKLVGATWSPPPWMKTNNQWSGFGSLRPEYYRTWAEYHLRYMKLMRAQGIDLWAISTGNEPLNGVIGWVFVHFMSLGWTSSNQGRWVGDHLGPMLRNSEFSHVKLLGADDQRYVFPWWFEQMQSAHPHSVNYLDGFVVHWYWDKLAPPSLLDRTSKLFPGKMIINTESCLGDKPWEVHGPVLGSWDRAEEYIRAYIEDLQHSVNGWIDWNLMLDESGGPNYSNNTVDAPVIVNLAAKEFYKQPMFYAIGHFSRFIAETAIRVDVQSNNNQVLAVGFEHGPTMALILYNRASQPAEITVIDGNRTLRLSVPPKSLHSVRYN